MYDVVIIGAGVTGCAIARELSRYSVKACVVEKCEDVCSGTSKANSAIIHAGFDAPVGSLMAEMNVKGNAMMDKIAADLDVPFKRNGSLVVCTHKEYLNDLNDLLERGHANGVPDLKIITGDEARAIESNLSDEVVGALYAPTGGIVCPFILTIAFAENAAQNGVEFKFNTEVKDFKFENGIYSINTSKGTIETKYIVNAAGVYADKFHNMVSARKIHITPRRGDYCLLDSSVGGFVKHTIFPQPTKLGKGVLVSPTIHGNIIVGPTAVDIENKEGTNTTQEGINDLIAKASLSTRDLPIRQVITSFAGLRAHEDNHEFVLGCVEDAPNFVDAAGIESPGLSSSPAIGVYIASILQEKLQLAPNNNFVEKRKGILDPSTLSIDEYDALIKKNPAYANVICRCETVTEGEIVDAIKRPLGARSLDGVKRRVRAGMGRCQGGFCSPRVMEILERETGQKMTEIRKSDVGSEIVFGRTKEVN